MIEALVARSVEVRALARSATAVDTVKALGAKPVEGDLDSVAAVTEAMRGCDVVFHSAAIVGRRARYVKPSVWRAAL